MTYNIRLDIPEDGVYAWENRKELIVDQIREYKPDIIVTQEGQIHQLQYLDSIFGHLTFFGIGRKDGNAKDEYCAIFYDTSKFVVEYESTFWLSETPDTVSIGWNAMFERICTYALFTSKANNKQFMIFNTHFDHFGLVARQQSAVLVHQKIEAINTENYPLILAGDFNSEPESDAITFLSNHYFDSKLTDSSLLNSTNGTFNGFDTSKQATRRIDYIFTNRRNVFVRKYNVISKLYDGKFASDHFPVVVEIELN
jgi:endonuclease/exonuclease/phosphatase family metal-dependent hydrolase